MIEPRPCMTPGCHYHIHDSPGRIQITVDLPAGVALTSNQHEVLHLMAEIGVAAALLNDGQPNHVDVGTVGLYRDALAIAAEAQAEDAPGGGA
uniref:Uncharacterized protein n=1 Tax=Caulobacter phage BL57 TaxID=3348355 RepID=A0AB74UH91_9VIRU